jgi:polyisoprenoid-binding protein YceI
MRFVCGILTAGLCGALALAADTKFALTGDNTKVEFTGTKKEGKHDGGFKKLNGSFTVPDGNLNLSKVEVTIETDSLYSDNPKLTEHLKAPDFFDVKTNPTAKFVSKQIARPNRAGDFFVTGDLTLNGKTSEVNFPAKIEMAGGTLKLTSEFKIDRTKFGMTYGQGKIDDQVTIRIKLEAKQ